MKYSSYQSVFNNVYLSSKIFATVHQIQRYRNSLKYDDITKVKWMYENNHICLLREKINRNIELHVDHRHLYGKIANTHPDIFIQLFESNRDRAVELIEYGMHTIENAEVIKYLVERGFGVETVIDRFEKLYKIELQAIQYLLENKLCPPPNFRLLLAFGDMRPIYNPTKARETKEKIEFVIQNVLQLPLTFQDSRSIVKSLLSDPTPLVFDAIEPLLDLGVENILYYHSRKNIYCSYREAVEDIRLVESEIFGGEKSVVERSDYPPHLKEWYACVGKDEQEFINTWNSLEHIIVVDDDIVFSESPIGERLYHIVSLISKSLRLVHFLISKGFTGLSKIQTSVKHDICRPTLKHHLQDISQQDRDLIKTMGRGDLQFINLVLSTFTQGYFESFNFFFKQFTQEFDSEQIHALLKSLFDIAAENRNLFLYESIEAMGYPFTDTMTSYTEFKSLLPRFGRDIDSWAEQQKELKCSTLLVSFIGGSNLIGFKYVFTKHKFSTLMHDNLLEGLAKCRNLVFIDHFWKNRSTCFIETPSTDEINTFFTAIFNRASANQNMLLLKYLVKNNCFNPNATKIFQEPYFSCKEPIDPKYDFKVLVHFVENRFFDSIDPYVKYLIDPTSICSHTFVEYLYRNQDKFNTTVSFQSMYDQMRFKIVDRQQLGIFHLKYHNQLMRTFVNRYGCQETKVV
ncbi:hypothetical protein CYY_002953 [Polysphondylium violaceum]|uniref:Uncharacterized protein n=1 Tax=Polysphondylium violaceum TaxID=133409 RepID=A0A8J4PXP1_9MYCE|nr:hypothetical protein CYY_002953 [Polysphondylium violaceum]